MLADASRFANAEPVSMEWTAMRTLRVTMMVLICAAALVPPALAVGQISYRFEMPDGGLPAPGPTDPNAPSS
jgi:hypothetical protein